ncbi:hypothetical protein ABL78_1983 [Leptomonas seymouri]|uniref:Uncharacterized protein n=1 Tax=Leptomonas seymouri TaxID=5684 RepID=A0A0N1HZZ3_LEPSE|nr:hypothetical protein ABL78_1983 [Leptomonas seymouri]|eukprot:KPI88938.1 hypothetical protein ABL78_1983 [Leptomonas seymouri]
MDKAKTLEVLRGMKFMQRKEEAKRRATFEVAQREALERHLHNDDSGSTAALSRKHSGPARATVLYDDAFPSSFYALSRRAFTDTLGGPSSIETAEDGKERLEGVGCSSDSPMASLPAAAAAEESDNGSAMGSDEESIGDLWGNEEGGEDNREDTEDDPTAAPGSKKQRRKPASQQGTHKASRGGRSDGRFTVQTAVRAPKLPRRLEEAVAEEERQRKRRRADDGDGTGF